MMMINRFRKSNYVLLLLTKVLTKHMLITGQSLYMKHYSHPNH